MARIGGKAAGVSLFIAVFLLLWVKTEGQPATRDFTDSFGAWLSAYNLVHPSVDNPFLLEDSSTSPNPAAHPYWYSHNGNFPIYFWAPAVFLKLPIPVLSLISGIILLIGIGLGHRLFCRLYGPDFGRFFFLVNLCNWSGVMLVGLNLVWAFAFPLFWGALLLEDREFRNGSRRNRAALMAVIALAWYFEWGFSLFLTLTLLFARWLRREKTPIGWTLMLVFPAVLSALALRFLQVGATIGFDVLIDDILFTISNRAFASPSRAFLKAFYESHSLVLWGYEDQVFTREFWDYNLATLSNRLTDTFFPGAPYLFAILTIITLIPSPFVRARRYFRFPLEARAALLALVLVWTVIPAHVAHLYIHPFQPLLIFPLSLLMATLLARVWESRTLPRLARLSVFGVLALWPLSQWHQEDYRPLPGAEVFHAYFGKTFATNYLAAYPRYFTNNWATTVWGTLTDTSFGQSYVHEANRTQVDYLRPDYFLCIDNPYVAPCRVSELFHERHPIVASGKGFAIYALNPEIVTPPNATIVEATPKWSQTQKLSVIGVKALYNSRGSLSGWSGADEMANRLSAGWQVSLSDDQKFPWGVVTDRTAQIEIETTAGMPALNTLAFLPQEKKPQGYFSAVIVEGSQDRTHWQSLARISQRSVPVIGDWSTWLFPNERAFRFYRLTFAPQPGERFLALQDFRLARAEPKSEPFIP